MSSPQGEPVRFEVALFQTSGDQRGVNKSNYHNPKRQRGIFGNTHETQKLNPSLMRFEVASFATAVDRAWKNSGNHHHPKRQQGIFANTAEAQKRNPSLTRRVGIGTNAQLQNLCDGTIRPQADSGGSHALSSRLAANCCRAIGTYENARLHTQQHETQWPALSNILKTVPFSHKGIHRGFRFAGCRGLTNAG